MHSTVLKVGLLQPKRERRKKTGLQACVCTFECERFLGWGSEGVNKRMVITLLVSLLTE